MPRKSLESRTDEKLRYAQIHLEELQQCPRWDPAQPFVTAHEEAILYQVISARDAFLQEINAAYGLGLSLDEVRLDTVRKALQQQKKTSPAFDEIYRLSYRRPKKRWSWLGMTLEIRDHGAHRARPPREYFEGGPEHGTIRYRSPRYRRKIKEDIPTFLGSAIAKMDDLIRRLRRTLPP